MNEIEFKRNENLAQTVIKGLKSRNMEGFYAASKEEALKKALKIIPEGASVTMGGCQTAADIGLTAALKDKKYNYLDRNNAADKRAAELAAYGADYFIASANAITNDGVIVNIDGNSNRVSCLAYGPEHVLYIIGMNKVCPDIDSAIKRARNIAAPINATRFGVNTPCTKTGACADCKSPETICCNFLITRFERHAGRLSVILINDDQGF